MMWTLILAWAWSGAWSYSHLTLPTVIPGFTSQASCEMALTSLRQGALATDEWREAQYAYRGRPRVVMAACLPMGSAP